MSSDSNPPQDVEPTTSEPQVSSNTHDGSTPAKKRRSVGARTLIPITLLSLCVALFCGWLLVIRPAANDSDVVSVNDVVDSAGLQNSATDDATVGEFAPAVTIEGLDGDKIVLSALRGKPVVLNFWASTCAPCVKEMPLLERAHQRLGDKVTFVGIDVFESKKLGTAMVDRTGVSYRQGRDPKSTLIAQFGGLQLPHTVVIDADGKVTAMRNKAITSDAELEQLIGDVSR